MARSIFRKLLSLGRSSKKKSASSPGASPAGAAKLSRDLAANLSMIRDALGNSMDVVIRELVMCRTRVALIYIDGIIDKSAMRENVLRALMVDTRTVSLTRSGWQQSGRLGKGKGAKYCPCKRIP